MDKVYIKNNKILSNLSSPLYNGPHQHLIERKSWLELITVLWKSETDPELINISKENLNSFLTFCGNHLYNALCAGCLISNKHQFLALQKNGHLEFPKGFIDPNETAEQAAIRESQEETGLNKIVLQNFVMDTFHIYEYKSEFTFKKTTWFLASTLEDEVKVQKEEGFEGYQWMDKNELLQSANLFHANIIELMHSILH